MFTRRDRWQTAGIVFLVTCGGVLFALFRAAQIAHVQWF